MTPPGGNKTSRQKNRGRGRGDTRGTAPGSGLRGATGPPRVLAERARRRAAGAWRGGRARKAGRAAPRGASPARLAQPESGRQRPRPPHPRGWATPAAARRRRGGGAETKGPQSGQEMPPAAGAQEPDRRTPRPPLGAAAPPARLRPTPGSCPAARVSRGGRGGGDNPCPGGATARGAAAFPAPPADILFSAIFWPPKKAPQPQGPPATPARARPARQQPLAAESRRPAERQPRPGPPVAAAPPAGLGRGLR